MGKAAERLEKALLNCKQTFFGVAVVSCVINLLMLTSPLFMLQIYDRVLTSRSISTLVALAAIAATLYAFYGFLEGLRSKILSRIGARLDASLSDIAFEHEVNFPLRCGCHFQRMEPTRDLDLLRQFFSGPGPSTLFDMPWMPVYLAIVFLFHPLLGFVALGGVLFSCLLISLNEFLMRQPNINSVTQAAKRHAVLEGTRSKVEVVTAMGMIVGLGAAWARENDVFRTHEALASDRAAIFGAITKASRLVLQSSVLGTGAYLAINGSISPGILVAASIITSRAVAPIDQAVTHWRGFMSARQGLDRLRTVFDDARYRDVETKLPLPANSLDVEGVFVTAPGSKDPIVRNVSLSLKAGDALGIVGPSGSGKSTLGRVLVGIWPTAKGSVRLDGSDMTQWKPEELGATLGYLPQDVQLFAGTVAQNIARFQPDWDSHDVIQAAQLAQAHTLITRLPEGYDTQIGDAGAILSGGQRQRIALARAFYGSPFLIVLDEPNSNLDAEGEAGLTAAIKAATEKGCIVVVIAHRPSAIAAVEKLLYIQNGQIGAFGPKDEVLQKLLSLRGRQGAGLRVVGK